MARHSFQPRNSLFPCFSLYFPTLRALLREISPIIFSALPFLHSVNAFPIRASLILHALLHLHLPIYSHPPQSSYPLRSLPHFLSLSSPLFHLPSQLTNDRAHPRALRAYAYARPYLPVRRFLFIAFTASPTLRNSLCTNALGVKENKKKPSQNTQQPQNQHINTKHPISSAMNPSITTVNIKAKTFTPYALCHNLLRHTGEEVKDKNENLLTRARVYAYNNRHVSNGCYTALLATQSLK